MKRLLFILLLPIFTHAQTISIKGNVKVKVNSNTVPPAVVCSNLTPVTYTIGTGSGTIYRPDLSALKGGDTLKIANGNYDLIELNSMHGDACRKIVITKVDSFYCAVMRLKNDVTHFEFSGGDTASGLYKIKTNVFAVENCRNFWIHNVWGAYNTNPALRADNGFIVKTQPDYFFPLTWYPNYTMDSIKITYCKVVGSLGEALYIGHTEPNGKWTYNGPHVTGQYTDSIFTKPVQLGHVEIAYNDIDSCGWDGIQLSNARDRGKIHHNTVKHYGLANAGSQQAGIILGGNTTGEISYNTVIKGTGNGIEAFGYSLISIHHNTLDSCGHDGTTNGQHSVFTNDYLISVNTNPKQQISFLNNHIAHPPLSGVIKISFDNNNSLYSDVENNTNCIPGAGGSWLSANYILDVPGTVNLNNTLLCP